MDKFKDISSERQRRIRLKAIELYEEGMGYLKIKQEIERIYDVDVGKSTIVYWVSVSGIPIRRKEKKEKKKTTKDELRECQNELQKRNEEITVLKSEIESLNSIISDYKQENEELSSKLYKRKKKP